MLARVLICLCSLAVILCVPVKKTIPGRRIEPASARLLPHIDLPYSIVKKTKYELRGGGHEGDMIFPKGFNVSSLSEAKGVAAFGPRRWPNGIIPYDISAITSSRHRDMIVEAMQILMYAVATSVEGETKRKACVYFRPRERGDTKFFRITYGSGCSGTVGYWDDSDSTMTLNNPGCFYSGTIQHELMHILGFYHEQSRPDRDSYITINYRNIERGMSYNFEKLQWGVTALNQKTAYDYGSIMHYESTAFSSNGRPTITSKKPNVVVGQREALSAIDITEIRNYYSC